jgi:H+/Cl- antiporter ClcA
MDNNIVMPVFAVIFFGLLLVLAVIAATIFWIWMLVDCVRYESSEGITRVVWVLVILFLPGLGALLYFLIRRPERRAQLQR